MIVAAARRERPVEVIVGDLEARLAETEAEILAAQELRYRVFYGEMGAKPSAGDDAARAVISIAFDPYCDHLIVVDRKRGSGVKGIVATYRLLRREAREARRALLLDRRLRHLAAGQPAGRDPGTGPLLRRSRLSQQDGDAAAVEGHHRLHPLPQGRGDVRLRELPGTDPEAHRMALSYLHHRHLAPPQFRPQARWPTAMST